MNLIGQTLGKYRILEEIGSGGMGVVYKAHDTALDRILAFKVLAPHLTWDQEFVNRFHREARAAARLKHSHIVTIYDVGQVEGYHFIAMDYLEGQPLSTLIRREGPLAPKRIAHIVGQIASALDYAHARGVVHRDVKPGNVIVGPEDYATLTDFGVAKALAGTELTRTGTLLGTPAYMSPEQVKGEKLTPVTDIYSLGLVAYEMLTGRVPFQAETPHAVLHAQVYEPPPPLRQMNPQVLPDIEAVVLRALAKEPGQRYSGAEAFAAALRHAVEPAKPEDVPKPAPPTPPSLPGPRADRALLWPLFGALGALLVIAALALSLSWYRAPESISHEAAGKHIISPTTTSEQAGPVTTTPQATSLLEFPVTSEATPRPWNPADVNGDGVVDIRDLGRVAGAYDQAASVDPASDVNADGQINLSDLMIVANSIVSPEEEHTATPAKVATELPATHTPRFTLTPTPLPSSPTQPPPVPRPLSPTPTVTRTRTPAPPTRTPPGAPTTAPAGPAITLLEPVNGARVPGLVTFRWTWQETLRTGEIFDVRVCKGADCQPRFGRTNVGETTWTWCPDWTWVSPPGVRASVGPRTVMRWQVVVIDGTSKQAKGPTSEVWQFTWEGGAVCGPSTAEKPPTDTPVPRPTVTSPAPPQPTPTPVPYPYP